MSWWTKNRKWVGLLGAAAAAVASGGTASPLLGGLLGSAPAAGGVAAGTAGALGTGASLAGTGLAGAGAAGALGSGMSMAGTGLGAASTALPAMAAAPSFMNAGLTAANGFGNMAAMSSQGGLLSGLGKGVNAGMKGMQIANMMSPQQTPPPTVQPRPPQAPQAPTPVGPGYTPVDNQPPPGFDPNQWALMSPEQKAAFKAQRGMA